MADVKITFNLQLSNSSTKIQEAINAINDQLKILESQGQKVTASVEKAGQAMTSSFTNGLKAIKNVNDGLILTEAEVTKLGRKFDQQLNLGNLTRKAAKDIRELGVAFADLGPMMKIDSHNMVGPFGTTSTGDRNMSNVFAAQAKAQAEADARFAEVQGRMARFHASTPFQPALGNLNLPMNQGPDWKMDNSKLVASQVAFKDMHEQLKAMIPTVSAFEDANKKMVSSFSTLSTGVAPTNKFYEAAKAQQTLHAEFKNMIPTIGAFDDANGKLYSNLNLIGKGTTAAELGLSGLEVAEKSASAMTVFLADTLSALRTIITFAIPAAVIGELASLTSGFIDLNTSFTKLQVTGRFTNEQMKEVSDSIVELSTHVPRSAADLTEAMNEIYKAGYSGATAFNMLKVSAMLATAGFTDTKTAADALNTVLTSYHMSADKVMEVSDTLVRASQLGKVNIEDFSHSLGRIAVQASFMGVSVNELAAAMALMTKHGMSAEQAATLLARVMTKTSKPSQGQAAAAVAGAPLDPFVMKQKGLLGFIQNLNKDLAVAIQRNQEKLSSLNNIDDAIKIIQGDMSGASAAELGQIFPDIRALREVMDMVGTSAGDFQANLDALNNSAGATKNAFDVAKESLSNLGQVVKNDLMASFVPLGETIFPALALTLLVIVRILGLIAQLLTVSIKYWYMTAIAIAAVWTMQVGLYSATMAVAAAFDAAWASALLPITLVVAGLAALLAILHEVSAAFGTTGENAGTSGNFMVDVWNGVQDTIKGVAIILYTLVYIITSVVAAVIAGVQVMGSYFGNFYDWMRDNWSNFPSLIKNAFINMWNGLLDILSTGIEDIGNAWNLLIDKLHLPASWKAEWKGAFNFAKLIPDSDVKYVGMKAALGFSQAWTDAMNNMPLGLGASPTEMWKELQKAMPDKTMAQIKDIVLGTSVDLQGIDPKELEALKSQLRGQTNNVNETIKVMNEQLSAINGDITNLGQALRESVYGVMNMGNSAQMVADGIREAATVEILSSTLDSLNKMKAVADFFYTKGLVTQSKMDLINNALTDVQGAYLNASDSFLEKLLSLGSPEDLAKVFAQQHYISQNINQSVVIAPYIEISGVQDEEAVIKTVDTALTTWANQHGLSLGTT